MTDDERLTIRANLCLWALWRTGVHASSPAIELIEAVYESGILSPDLQEALRLVYLDPRQPKTKYRNRSPTEYHVAKRLAEDAVAHLVGRLSGAVEA